MPDFLTTGSNWLQAQRKTHLSRTVVYQRGDNEKSVAATIGKWVFQVDSGNGMILDVESRDFLVTAADLVVGGERIEPKRGDRIIETVGSETHVYEVSSPGNESFWIWSDLNRVTYRIHTKLVSKTP